jgi:hypothetical protein
MNDNDSGFFMFMSCILFFILLYAVKSCEDNYSRGQIDALNGKITVEKVENEDGELIWKNKEGQ